MGKKQDLVKKLALEHLKFLDEAASPSAIRKSLDKIVAAAKDKLEPKPKPKRKAKPKPKASWTAEQKKRAMTQREEDLEKILQHEKTKPKPKPKPKAPKAKSPFDDLPPLNERKWEVKNLEPKPKPKPKRKAKPKSKAKVQLEKRKKAKDLAGGVAIAGMSGYMGKKLAEDFERKESIKEHKRHWTKAEFNAMKRLAREARRAGEDTFEYEGKTYQVDSELLPNNWWKHSDLPSSRFVPVQKKKSGGLVKKKRSVKKAKGKGTKWESKWS